MRFVVSDLECDSGSHGNICFRLRIVLLHHLWNGPEDWLLGPCDAGEYYTFVSMAKRKP
jgi:hypothetical protein